MDLSYPWINVFSSLIFFLGVYAFARKQRDKILFLTLLFPVLIINMPMSGIRQATAIGLMLLAFVSFTEQRTVRFGSLTLVAATIHNSSLIFLLLTPFISRKLTARRVALSLILGIPGVFALLLSDAVELATNRYINSDVEAAGAIYRISLLAATGLFFMTALRRRWFSLFRADYLLVLLGSGLMILLFVALPLSTVIADRFGYYLVPLQATIIARVGFMGYGQLGNVFRALPLFILLVVLAVWTYYSAHFNICYLPYRSWLFGLPADAAY